MESPAALNPIQEEYLLAVSILKEKNHRIPMSTLANHFNTHIAFARSAINGMVQMGLLELSPHIGVHLTQEGEMRARDVERRRTAIAEALSDILELDGTTAREAARNLRRALSRSDINRIICSRCMRRMVDRGEQKPDCSAREGSAEPDPSCGHILAHQLGVVDVDSPEHGAVFKRLAALRDDDPDLTRQESASPSSRE